MRDSKYTAMDDAEIVARCLEGEGPAWEALITKYRRLIYSIAVNFGLPTNDVNDVFQAVCVKLIEHLTDLKEGNKVSSWLITITTRECIAVRTMKFRLSSTDDLPNEPQVADINLEELQIQAQRRQAVRDAVGALPERCRNLLTLLFLNPKSLSYEEVSRTLGMPVASIGPTRARCLERLRTVLRRLRVHGD